MKRLCAVLSLALLLSLAAMPAIARADDDAPPAAQSQPAPDGWTWDESAPTTTPDGWTWDESSATPAPESNSTPAPDGWTWDES
jgi:hypothetical protein